MSSESSVVSLKKSFRDLLVWQKAIFLSKEIYRLTEDFPKREHYGLAAQMRRAAVSVASNIAEGAARHTNTEYANFLVMARGSLAELITQTIIASETGLMDPTFQQSLEEQCTEISRMLNGLRKKLLLTTDD